MKYQIYAHIKIINEVDPNLLDKGISPENSTMPIESGKVVSYVDNDQFLTEIEGNMSIGRLIHTLDDVIKTAILIKNVNSENEAEDYRSENQDP